MGYFKVDAFSANRVTQLRGLYYSVVGYSSMLGDGDAEHLLVRVDGTSTARYRALPIDSFLGIRVYASDENGNRPLGVAGVNPIETLWSVCNPESDAYDPALCEAMNRVNGYWNYPINAARDIEYSPLWSQRPADALGAELTWQAIKPGDIAITVIEKEDGTEQYPHIQIVIGWGPSVTYKEYTPDAARLGEHLYTTYAAVPPDKRSFYVPYVADRYRKPGDGMVPRPFNFGMLHTSTDFWVADYFHP